MRRSFEAPLAPCFRSPVSRERICALCKGGLRKNGYVGKHAMNEREYVMKNQKRLSRLSAFQMLGVTLLLLTIGIWQVWGCTKTTFISYFAGLLALGGAAFFSIKFKIIDTQIQRNTLLLVFLEGISCAFLYFNYAEVEATIGVHKALLLVAPLAAVAVMHVCQSLLVGRFHLPSRSTVLKGLVLGGICIIFAFILNLECFNMWPHWDTFSYYFGLEAVSAKNIFCSGPDGLIVCSHAAVSYALWSFLFRSIPGITHVNALYLSNMVLIAIDFFLFFLVFRHLFPGKSFVRYTLSATAATVAPWIFGTAYALNADHLTATGALLLLYAVFSENYMLSVLAVFVLCGAREIGGGVAAAVIFLQMVYSLYKRKEDKTAKFHWMYYLMCLGIGVMWLGQTLVSSNWVGANGSTVDPYWRAMDGSGWNRFGVYWPYITDVLRQTFLVNFRWFFCGLILASLIKLVFKHFLKKEKTVFFISRYLYVVIAGALFISAAEQCSFITFIQPRYYSMSNAFLSLLAISSIQYLVEGVRWEKVISSCATCGLAVVLLIESYTTIDPVTTALYFTMKTGKSVVAAAPQREINSEPSFGESCTYNRQELYYLKAMDEVYSQIDSYSDGFKNATVLCSNEYIIERGTIGSLYMIWGFGYTYIDPQMYGHWNREGGYRYLSYKPPKYSIDPIYILGDTDLSEYLDAGKDVFYIEMPWWDTVIGPIQERYPDTELFSTVEYMGWVLRVYKIQ